MNRFLRKRRVGGFTIIELMVSLSVLTILSLFSGRIYLNYTASTRDLKASNLIYEEARFLMERLVREVRQSGIDYEQYWNQNVNIPFKGGTYTDNYCEYGMFFTDNGQDGIYTDFEDNESTGFRNVSHVDTLAALTPPIAPEAVLPIEKELYLINIAGDKRTMIKRIARNDGTNDIGKISMLKLNGKDFGTDHINRSDPLNDGDIPSTDCLDTFEDTRENDGLIDTWHCDENYPCDRETDIASPYGALAACRGYGHTIDPINSFIDISPEALNIVDLKFIISPSDDPWKAYSMNNVQIQPNVTIQLTAEANPKLVSLIDDDRVPSITLTTTVTTRIYDEIKSSCF